MLQSASALRMSFVAGFGRHAEHRNDPNLGGITRDSDAHQLQFHGRHCCEKNQNFAKRQGYGIFQKL
jgi:hypothetical protein